MANGTKTNGKKHETEPVTTLALRGHGDYAIAKAGLDNLPALLRENIGPGGIDATDLDRVGMPAGGGLQWMVPTLDGEKPSDSIEGVIISWRLIRLYWAKSIDQGGAGNPPDCISHDAMVGIGKPGGDCSACPFAQFGSAAGKNDKPGRGQACKMVRQLFIMRQGDILPLVVNLPPSSLKAIKKYFLRLTMNGKRFHDVVTRLTLDRTKNNDGIAYSLVNPSLAGELDEAAKDFFNQIAAAYAPLLTRVPIDSSAYEVAGETDEAV